MFKRILLPVLFFLCLPIAHSLAERGSALPDVSDSAQRAGAVEEKTGPAYTTKDAERAAKTMKKRSLPVVVDERKEEDSEEALEENPKTAEEEIMEKYKALAAGSAEEEDAEKSAQETAETQENDEPRPGSMQSVLEGYKKRVGGGANMHSRSMPLPEDRKK